MDQRTNGSLQSQGSSSLSPGRLDQDVPMVLGSVEFPELSYPDDHQEWGHVSSGPLDQQTEISDPLMGNSDAQTLVSPNEDSPICLDDGLGKPLSLRESRASWDPDAGNGCLEKGNELTSADASSESMELPVTESLGSVVGNLESTDTHDRGKTPKSKKAPPIDPCLRDALTAVFSNPNPGKDDGSDPEIKSTPEIGSQDMVHVSEISPCRMDSRIALPRQAVTSGNQPDDQDPCLKASTDENDLTDQEAKIQKLLQVIKAAGYVIRKETKSQAGFGQSNNNLTSGVHKKRNPVQCPSCKFHGRPCELK